MLVSEIITQVKYDIRQDGGGFTDAELLKFVIEGNRDFVRYTEALETLTAVTVPAYSSLVSLPTEWLEGRQNRWSYNLLIYPKTQRQMHYDEHSWVTKVSEKPTNVVYWNWGVVRLYPIPSVAGTVSFRHSYVTTVLQYTDEPSFPKMWHGALVDYVDAECFYTMRKYDNGDEAWMRYVDKRSKAKMQFTEGQRTPDTLQGMRPKSNFNWQLWNQRGT